MMFAFKWKLIGSDAFEQQIYGDDLADAMDTWQELWGITTADCEAFSFSMETARMVFDFVDNKNSEK